MTTKRVAPTGTNEIIARGFDQKFNGHMTQAFRSWINEVNRAIPLSGTGSPEDVVEAVQGQTYQDLVGGANLINYVKTVDDVAGDKKKGWLLG